VARRHAALCRGGGLTVRYFRVWLLYLKTVLVREMEFRANFFAWMVINLCWMVLQLTFFWVIYRHTDRIGGWDANELQVLLGTYYWLEFFVWAFGYPNLGRMSTYVDRGELDFFLLKPLNAQFQVSLRRFSPHNTASLIPATVLLVSGIRGAGLQISLGQAALFLVLFAAGVLIFYSLWFLSVTLIFWMTRGSNLQELFLVTLQVERVPTEIFSPAVAFLVSFVVPVAMVTVFPTRALLGSLGPQLAAYMVVAAAALLWVSSRFWRFVLRRYASASS
jgi:ABC-2 type transport system permease protein